jgi:hypothetical protein
MLLNWCNASANWVGESSIWLHRHQQIQTDKAPGPFLEVRGIPFEGEFVMTTNQSELVEALRRSRLVEINLARADRATLEARHGQVWDTGQLRQEFEVLELAAPYVVVRRKSDGVLGSLEFHHEPRFYFNFKPDQTPNAEPMTG